MNFNVQAHTAALVTIQPVPCQYVKVVKQPQPNNIAQDITKIRVQDAQSLLFVSVRPINMLPLKSLFLFL